MFLSNYDNWTNEIMVTRFWSVDSLVWQPTNKFRPTSELDLFSECVKCGLLELTVATCTKPFAKMHRDTWDTTFAIGWNKFVKKSILLWTITWWFEDLSVLFERIIFVSRNEPNRRWKANANALTNTVLGWAFCCTHFGHQEAVHHSHVDEGK